MDHVCKYDGVETKIIVYDSEEERVRDCLIKPNRYWGGRGLLGCDIVRGMFHVMPARRKNMWSSSAEEPNRVRGAFNLEEMAESNLSAKT
jgi:hypothetical protein